MLNVNDCVILQGRADKYPFCAIITKISCDEIVYNIFMPGKIFAVRSSARSKNEFDALLVCNLTQNNPD